MAYLTYQEFEETSGPTIDAAKFDKLLPKASAILDNVTDHFYTVHNIETDNKWRVKKFKEALCVQINYFDEVGANTFEGINKAPQSFSAGRTSVSNTSRFNAAGANESKSLVAEDVYVFLEGTGLLYAGVGIL
ncbi:hypothetical protein [Alkalibacterium sp. MB6]|uniref:hypothetical protein n=1 Tax=Alkalibacterium sp. MB6 TaxID=2081965 RepID=UPI0013795198|nr:hypothetical protein [Alkalibacterium sp. MB6]